MVSGSGKKGQSSGKPMRVLVVEDSATVRQALTHLFNSDPDLEVVGTAHNGKEAVLRTMKLKPDVITMDALMPEMDGVEATTQIMRQMPTPIVIVTAHAEDEGSNLVFESLKAGAIEIVSKPSHNMGDASEQWGADLIATIKAVALVEMSGRSCE